MLLMAARETGRSTLFTVIVSDFEFVPPAPSLTLIEAVAVPESLKPGARCAFPVVALVVVTVRYVGPETFEKVSGSASGSLPERI